MSREMVITVKSDGPLLAWLLTELAPPMSRTRVKELLARGAVTINGMRTTRHDHPIQLGDRVTIRLSDDAKSRLNQANIVVIHEDEDVIVVDKPSGLLSVATETEKIDTVFVRLGSYLKTRKAGRPFVVHRLDRDTSGLLLFARSAASRDQLQQSWDEVSKTYLAIVQGRPRQEQGHIENHLVEGPNQLVRACDPDTHGAKRAVSHYKLLKQKGVYSLLEVTLVTGRKHQIRVHMTELGCPIIGDPYYGQASDPVGRLGLHATRLCFPHPRTKNLVRVESALPASLQRLVGEE